jgi:dTDP-4-amino-4,6-dideoxygalactose transaminase
MDQIKIVFNKPYLTGKEMHYMYQAVYSGKISGNGIYTRKCHEFFEKRYNFKRALLTTSCTDALEMTAMLANIQPGDEVIIPSYTFVSTALAFVRQGAKIIFADSGSQNPNMDVSLLEALITPRTKAIVPVHYAGIACDMENPEFPVPIGVFRAVERPTFEVELNRQVEAAIQKEGPGNLEALLNSGDVWEV